VRPIPPSQLPPAFPLERPSATSHYGNRKLWRFSLVSGMGGYGTVLQTFNNLQNNNHRRRRRQ